jgi:tagaturonate reductase
VDGGEVRREYRVVSSVSRALSARDQWDDVLACARDPRRALVFSNTTEVGIALDPDDEPTLAPPRSFPGKLTRFLYERARAVDYDAARGVVVLPCELIEHNGDRLREIVLALAARWELGDAFAAWIAAGVPFCNTHVDRIVPGAPTGGDAEAHAEALGYDDEMLTSCEVYRLFAIEASPAVRARLGFADADPGILVTDDVRPYRERKVRLLNGAHTALVPAALLAGCETVREAVEHEHVGRFLRRVLFEELVPSVEVPGAEPFAREVLDRFANPFIRHALFDITLQGTMKTRVRVVPSVVEYAARVGRAPASLAFGFAAYLAFMRGELQDARRAAGRSVPADEQGARVRARWDALAAESEAALGALARDVCADEGLWGTDLTRVEGFADLVSEDLVRTRRAGAAAALQAHHTGATV